MKRKILCMIGMIFAVVALYTVSASAITRDQAVNWAKTQADNGVMYKDSGNGGQCTDFVSAYMNYIVYGDAHYWKNSGGKGFRTYDAKDYFSKSYPSGWQKISNTSDFVPQPGDILCFGANSSNSFGHVAVAIEGCTVSIMKGVGQNGAANNYNGTAAQYQTMQYFGGWGNFQGVIRPKWDSGDTTPPTITDAKVVGVDANGYMLQCSVSDSSGISSVKCATWTQTNGQDDLIWNDMVNTSPGIWKLYINFSKHNSEKNVVYLNHIYAYDTNNNQSFASVDYNEWNPPVISYGEIVGVDSNGYMVECKVSDDTGLSKVRCATWTNENGQDDLVWTDMVNTSPGIWKLYIHFSEHGKNTPYANDIYAYDTFQKESKCYSVPFDYWDLNAFPFAVYKYNDHINVINLAPSSKTAAVIFAKYDGSKLVDSSFINESFTSGERKSYSKSGNEYNAFIWDSPTGMKPLAQ